MLGSWVDSGFHGVLAVLTATQRQFVAVAVTVGLFGLVVVLSFLRSRTLYGDSRPSRPDDLTNCPACGARVEVARDRCSHCGEAVGEE